MDEVGAADAESPEQRADTPPVDVLDEAERLTRLARETVDDSEAAAYRCERTRLLGEHDYTARVRSDDTRDVLVCHPAEWVEDGTIQLDHVEDVERGIERPLSGPGDPDEWAIIEAHNRELAESVAAEHGSVHGANAHALADFMGNHYAKPIEEATRGELVEFRTEYYPRNAWPDEEQKQVLEESIRLTFAAADSEAPR